MIVKDKQTTVQMIAAAYLHDVLEDANPPISSEFLKNIFGSEVTQLVVELTNPSKQYPELSRKDRKEMDRKHLAQVSREAKIIKMTDMLDNYSDMQRNNLPDVEFVTMYVGEGLLLLPLLADANPQLAIRVNEVICALWDLK